MLDDLGKPPFAHDCKDHFGKDFQNTHKRLIRLWTAGKIKKEEIEGKTFYFLPIKEQKIEGSELTDADQ